MGIRVYDKTTQQVVEVTSEEAAAGFGENRFAPVDKTLTFSRGGETWEADATDLGQMLGQGFSLVDQEQANAIDLRREESDPGSTVQGMGERIASGATFGLSSLAADALGADPERMAARAESLDWVGTGLEVLGGIASSPFTGGASLESGLARGLASAGASRTALRLLPSTGRAMVEGAAQGAGVAVDESVLGNRDLAADQLFRHAATGLFLGGGAGLGLSAVAMGARRASVEGMRGVLGRGNSASGGLATREAAEAVTRAGEQAAEPGWISKALELQAKVNQGGPEAVAAAKRLGALLETVDGTADINRVFAGMKAIQGEAMEGVGTTFRGLNDGYKAIRMKATGEAKARQIDRLIPTESQHVTARALGDQIGEVRKQLDEMIATNSGRYGGPIFEPAMLRSMDDALQRAEFGAREAWQLSGSRQVGGGMHRVTDQLKRELGEILADNHGWAARPGLAPTVSGTNARLRDMYKALQAPLEDAGIVGEKAALAQAEINGAYRDMFAAEAAFRGEATGLGKILDPEHVLSDRQALQIVRQFGRLGGDKTIATLDNVLESRLRYFDKLEKHYDLDPGTRSEIAAMKKATEDLRDKFKRQAKFAGIADDLETARVSEGNRSPSILAASPTDMLAMGAGYMFGGVIGAALGRVGSYVARPYATMKVLASIKGLIDKTDLGMAEAIGRIGKRTRGESAPKRGGASGAFLASATVPRMNRDERRKEALKRAIDFSRSPESIERALAVPFYDLERTAPAVAGVLRNRVHAAAKFLASKAPKSYQAPMSTRPPLVAPSEVARFEKYLEAVTDPIAAVHRIADGNVTRESAEAIKAVYPALYADIQEQIQQVLADAQAEGREVPFDVRISLGLFFETPTDQALDPRMLAAIQGAVNTPEIEHAPIAPKRPLNTNSRAHMTNMQRLEDWSA